jgi:hypothetical protein
MTEPVLLADPDAVTAFMMGVAPQGAALLVSNCEEPWLAFVGVHHVHLTGVDGSLEPRDFDPCCFPFKVVWQQPRD